MYGNRVTAWLSNTSDFATHFLNSSQAAGGRAGACRRQAAGASATSVSACESAAGPRPQAGLPPRFTERRRLDNLLPAALVNVIVWIMDCAVQA